jgi:hypothetical protein
VCTGNTRSIYRLASRARDVEKAYDMSGHIIEMVRTAFVRPLMQDLLSKYDPKFAARLEREISELVDDCGTIYRASINLQWTEAVRLHNVIGTSAANEFLLRKLRKRIPAIGSVALTNSFSTPYGVWHEWPTLCVEFPQGISREEWFTPV